MDWANTTARPDEKHLSFGIRCYLYKLFDGAWIYIYVVLSWLARAFWPEGVLIYNRVWIIDQHCVKLAFSIMLRQQNCLDLKFNDRDIALQGQYLINLNNLALMLPVSWDIFQWWISKMAKFKSVVPFFFFWISPKQNLRETVHIFVWSRCWRN